MRAGPLPRADAVLLAGFATATGVDRLARSAAETEEAQAAVRFVETALVSFTWDGWPVYMTPTDVIALASGAVLIVRFLAWALAPLAGRLWRGGRAP